MHDGGQDGADLVGPLRMAPGVLLDGRPLAGPPAAGEFLGQFVHMISSVAGSAIDRFLKSSIRPGTVRPDR